MWSGTDIFVFFVPAILGYSSSIICNIGKGSGTNVSFRPPAFVFAIVWPILYACMGWSWVDARESQIDDSNKADIFYSILSVILALWIIVYSKGRMCFGNQKAGIYLIALAFSALVAAYSTGTQWSQILLAPLFGWLLLAILMNVAEVKKLKK